MTAFQNQLHTHLMACIFERQLLEWVDDFSVSAVKREELCIPGIQKTNQQLMEFQVNTECMLASCNKNINPFPNNRIHAQALFASKTTVDLSECVWSIGPSSQDVS